MCDTEDDVQACSLYILLSARNDFQKSFHHCFFHKKVFIRRVNVNFILGLDFSRRPELHELLNFCSFSTLPCHFHLCVYLLPCTGVCLKYCPQTKMAAFSLISDVLYVMFRVAPSIPTEPLSFKNTTRVFLHLQHIYKHPGKQLHMSEVNTVIQDDM